MDFFRSFFGGTCLGRGCTGIRLYRRSIGGTRRISFIFSHEEGEAIKQPSTERIFRGWHSIRR